jgi:hypothetical protein
MDAASVASLLQLLGTPLAMQALGIAALLLALWQLYQARSQTNALLEIRGALSTRYLGQFPTYVGDIADVVASARKRLDIVCDFPAYARFSDPVAWSQYRSALQAAQSRGVNVSLVCLDHEIAHELRNQQFAAERQRWEKWRSKNIARLQALLEDAGEQRYQAESLGFEEFISVLDEENRKMIQAGFPKAVIRYSQANMPVCSWIADGANAVFTVTVYTGGVLEHGFRTVDNKLITALRDMQRSYQTAVDETQRRHNKSIQDVASSLPANIRLDQPATVGPQPGA